MASKKISAFSIFHLLFVIVVAVVTIVASQERSKPPTPEESSRYVRNFNQTLHGIEVDFDIDGIGLGSKIADSVFTITGSYQGTITAAQEDQLYVVFRLCDTCTHYYAPLQFVGGYQWKADLQVGPTGFYNMMLVLVQPTAPFSMDDWMRLKQENPHLIFPNDYSRIIDTAVRRT